MDAAERELFAKSVQAMPYEELGFLDALEDDARSAVSIFFDLQGRNRTASPALYDVLGVDPPAVAAGAGLDPELNVTSLRGAEHTLPADALAAGHRALSHELLGAGRTMLEQAREHALTRIQFDKPIASFQAVRHKLADVFVYLEGADALLDAAWDEGSAQTAAMAKAFAGQAARLAAKHCQQVLAGIGFTTEHPFHLYLKRVLVLDQLLGSSATLTRQLGEEMLRTRTLPPIVSL